MATLRKKINRQLSEIPKYEINPEAQDAFTIALSKAFGRPSEIQAAEQSVTQSAADATGQAKDVSSSTSALLSAIGNIETGKQSTLRGLAGEEAAIQRQATGDVYAATEMLINEKDKEWYQNVYAPWESRLRSLQQQKANRDSFWSNLAGGLLGAAGQVIGGGAFGGVKV